MAPTAETFKVAVAGRELRPLLVSKSPAAIVLICAPAAPEVTFTVTVQVPGVFVPSVAIGIMPPAPKVTDVAVVIGAGPPHVVEASPTVVKPAGNKLSVSEVTVSAVSVLVLDSVMVSVDVPPAEIVGGLKLLLTAGAVAPVTKGELSAHPVTLFVGPANVTPAVSDIALPDRFPLPTVTLPAPAAPAMTVPGKFKPLRVAVLPTCQNT